LVDFGASIPRGAQSVSQSSFAQSISPSCPDPHVAQLDVEISDDGGHTATASFCLYIGETEGFDDDTESGEGMWMHSPITYGYHDQWHLDTYHPHSGNLSWKAGGIRLAQYLDNHDGGLVTPPFLLPEEATLRFWHWIDAEEDASPGLAWDGGIVLISEGDGQWTQIPPVSGYTHITVDNPASPFAPGTPCFSGTYDWNELEFDLTAYSGVVQIMFRFGSDAAVIAEGWYIDDISVEGSGCCGIYTGGHTGNANCDEDGKLTLSDISRIIDRVYISKAPLCCEATGNTNGSVDCKITLSDITELIDAVYISKQSPEPCMPECEQ
jgi:hypothetical protein